MNEELEDMQDITQSSDPGYSPITTFHNTCSHAKAHSALFQRCCPCLQTEIM